MIRRAHDGPDPRQGLQLGPDWLQSWGISDSSRAVVHGELTSTPESSPPRSRVFGGVTDATQEFLRVIVTATEHRLADGEDTALAVPGVGALLRRLEVQLRLQPQPRQQQVRQ